MIIMIRSVNKHCLLDTLRKVITALWILKSNVLKCIVASGCMGLGKLIQTDIWISVNGEVKVAVILSKRFSSSRLFHAHIEYVFHESAKH